MSFMLLPTGISITWSVRILSKAELQVRALGDCEASVTRVTSEVTLKPKPVRAAV